MSRVISTLIVAAGLAVSVGCATSHPPDPAHDADIPGAGGFVLKGSYYSPGKLGPAVLLLHQCNMDRRAWDLLTPNLVSAGLHVLTYDQRGFGDTPGGGPEDAQTSVADAESALAYLQTKRDVDRTRVAIGGASCGATFGASLASRHPEVRTLFVMSGWTDDRARQHISASPFLAVLGVAAARRRSDVEDVRQAVGASRHPESMTRIVEGGAHGVPMFDDDVMLRSEVTNWLAARLTAE